MTDIEAAFIRRQARVRQRCSEPAPTPAAPIDVSPVLVAHPDETETAFWARFSHWLERENVATTPKWRRIEGPLVASLPVQALRSRLPLFADVAASAPPPAAITTAASPRKRSWVDTEPQFDQPLMFELELEAPPSPRLLNLNRGSLASKLF